MNRANKDTEILYCSQRKCPYIECLRHDKNIPFGVMVTRSNTFKLDKELRCKDKII